MFMHLAAMTTAAFIATDVAELGSDPNSAQQRQISTPEVHRIGLCLQFCAEDFDLQDIVLLNPSRAVQLCVDIGAHLIASTEALPPVTETFEQLAQSGVIGRELALKLKKKPWVFATLPCITTMPTTGLWFTALGRTI